VLRRSPSVRTVAGVSSDRLIRVRDAVLQRPYHVGLAALCAGLAAAPGAGPVGLAVAGAFTVPLLMARAWRLALIAVALAVAGTAIGQWRIAAIDKASAVGPPGTAVSGRAVIVEAPRPSRFDSSAVVEMQSGRAAGAWLLARAGLNLRWPDGGEPGTIVWLRGVTKQPAAGRGFDWAGYLRRRGIRWELPLDALEPTGERRGGPLGVVDSMRRRAEVALGAQLSRGDAVLARGMVLGQDQLIDPIERDDFRRAGLAHVLAVSGQNVMLLCALALPLLGVAGAGRRMRIAVLLGLIAVYVPLAGAGPSLQRAGVMGAAGLIAVAAGRPASRWYALGLAAVVTLALNPRVAGDPGWQLSFAAVAGILVLGRPLQRALRGLPRLLAEGIALTLAATLATAPLIAHDFGSLSLAGIVANLVGLPLVAPIMWIGMLQVALAQVAGVLPGIGVALIDVLGSVNGVLLDLLRSLVRAFADAPGASVPVSLRSPWAVAGAYTAIAAAVLAICRMGRRLEPSGASLAATIRRLPRPRRIALVAAAAAMLAAGWRYANEPPAPPDHLTVRFLDVGQGDATLIQDGHGASVLFDGGPPEARVYRKLRSAGVARLDLMVATHQSRDHQGGLAETIDRIPTGTLLQNGDGTRDPGFLALLADAVRHHVRTIAARAGQVFRVGLLTIRILSPPPRPAGPPPSNPNDRAVAAIVSEGSFDLFLAADAESPALLPLPLQPVEAMKVSHHGSADSGLPELLRRLRPQVAAIEVGAHNSYGHPAASTMAVLARMVPRVYRTDRDGTVTLTVQPDGSEAVASEK
jgi:competence protein ComEC